MRQPALLEQGIGGFVHAPALAVVDRVLDSSVAPSSPADPDRDERTRRSRVDRDEIELASPDMDVPSEDGASQRPEPRRSSRASPPSRCASVRVSRSTPEMAVAPHRRLFHGSLGPALTSNPPTSRAGQNQPAEHRRRRP